MSRALGNGWFARRTGGEQSDGDGRAKTVVKDREHKDLRRGGPVAKGTLERA
ncbi:MAG: hypothetical protein AB7P03_30150 [Kofleriaceae bacterium]